MKKRSTNSKKWIERVWMTCCSLLVVQLLPAVAREAPRDLPRASLAGKDHELTLVWYDAYRLFEPSYPSMARETRQIFDEAGVPLRWVNGRSLNGVRVENHPLLIKILLMPVPSSDWGLERGVMAATIRNPGQLATVYVFYPDLLRTLGLGTEALDSLRPANRSRLARALGRVVSHEIVHFLAPYHPHADLGLMGARVNRKLLTRRHVSLDAGSVSVVLAELQARSRRSVNRTARDNAVSPKVRVSPQSWFE